MIGKPPRRPDFPALRVPRGVWVDTGVWLLIVPYHALSGWPADSSAERYFLEILGLAVLREIAQRVLVRRAATAIDFVWGLLFSLAVFSILGLGVRYAGIGSAWVIVSMYAALMLVMNEPLHPDSEPVMDLQWESARRRVGLTQVDLWHARSACHLIFSVGGRRPAVVVGEAFFLQGRSVRDFLFFHELGHLTLGHFRLLGYYNIALYAGVIVLSISAAALSDVKYLGPGHWLALGHCMACGLVMTWVGWMAQWIESELRLRLEAQADRFAVTHTGDPAAALGFLAACAEHPLEAGDGNHAGRRVPATRRLALLRQQTT